MLNIKYLLLMKFICFQNKHLMDLLKTLEEPPPHLKFIFATTEVKKIPVTIISRCQRFDLHRVSLKFYWIILKKFQN